MWPSIPTHIKGSFQRVDIAMLLFGSIEKQRNKPKGSLCTEYHLGRHTAARNRDFNKQ